jgi:hypothetical protein
MRALVITRNENVVKRMRRRKEGSEDRWESKTVEVQVGVQFNAIIMNNEWVKAGIACGGIAVLYMPAGPCRTLH